MKKYQNLKCYNDKEADPDILEKVMLERIDFTENCISITACDDTGRKFCFTIPKSHTDLIIIK